MNGVRAIFMRKGYLLTALAALALLAASPGTAAAQNTTGVTITGPSNSTVNEGGDATYTVTINGYVAKAAAADNPVAASEVTLTLGTPEPLGNDATTGEAGDVRFAGQATGTLTFKTPGNTSTTEAIQVSASQTITLATEHDTDAENEKFSLTFTLTADGGLDTTAAGGTDISLAAAGTAAHPNRLTIDDDEEQSYVLKLSPADQTPTEGTAVTVALSASPKHEDGSESLQVNIDQSGTGWGVTIADGDGSATSNPATVDGDAANDVLTVTIANPANDKNRVADSFTVSAHSGKAGASTEEASLTIDLADKNALQKVAVKVSDKDGKVLETQPTSVEEGGSVYIVAQPLDAKTGKVTTANENLEIALAPTGSADARDYSLGGTLKITSGQNKSNAVKIDIGGGDDDVGVETLAFDATVSGVAANGTETLAVAGVFSIDIEDATAKKVAPRSDADLKDAVAAAMADAEADGEGLNPGESFTVTADDLFESMDGYDVGISASVVGDAVSYTASGNGVTVTADKAGEATVTVTGTASAASASATGSQSISNVAHVEIPVTVTNKVLTLTLEAAWRDGRQRGRGQGLRHHGDGQPGGPGRH